MRKWNFGNIQFEFSASPDLIAKHVENPADYFLGRNARGDLVAAYEINNVIFNNSENGSNRLGLVGFSKDANNQDRLLKYQSLIVWIYNFVYANLPSLSILGKCSFL